MWTARRILKELTDSERRKRVLTAFWKHGDAQTRAAAAVQLARAMHFRDETIRKMPPEKKADLLATRIAAPEFEQHFEVALMHYHTHEANEMMAAFLDQWGVPHQNGSIDSDDYTPPTAEQVRAAVQELEGKYDKRDVALYLAAAGLLMGDEWAAGTWPVADELNAR